MLSLYPVSTTLFGQIICLVILSAVCISQTHAQDDDSHSNALLGSSIIGHDPRLFYRVAPMIMPRYNARIARGRPPFYSQRILGRLSDSSRSNFLPERNSPQGLYWMRPDAGSPLATPASTSVSSGSGGLTPRGPLGMRMLADWNPESEAARRPLPPLWSLLQTPRNARRSRRAIAAYSYL